MPLNFRNLLRVLAVVWLPNRFRYYYIYNLIIFIFFYRKRSYIYYLNNFILFIKLFYSFLLLIKLVKRTASKITNLFFVR
jgi:hypothetical protein